MLVMVPALTVRVALLDPARTLTDAGNVRTFGIAPERVTDAPPVGAALVKHMMRPANSDVRP